jgi:chromosome segregation ATPase
MRSLLLTLITCSSLLFSSWAAAQISSASKVIYRYKNKDGVTVLDSKIPPQYVNNGYEIVSLSGKVIKVIAPVTQGAEGERLYKEKLQREEREREDIQLRRSYSNVGDIEAAKTRNLESLRGNIGILQANLTSARSRLQTYQSQAAAIERAGRKLPEDLLKNINNLVQEEKDIQVQIQQREDEYKTVEQKFDADRTRFVEITQ